MERERLLLGVTIVVLIVGMSFSGLIFAAPNTGTSLAQTETPQSQTGCDYTAVYDQSIDSVAAVQTNSGLGSGFVYQTFDNGTGYVVTNAHVVGTTRSVIVQFTNSESQIGTVIGRDRSTDLAVIRVNQTPEDTDAIQVASAPPDHGQQVAALGNPFGLEETITHGIISGLNRTLPTQRGFTIPNVVQTDAPISAGNSGGPLVACNGTLVGVNTAGIAARGAENIGFAISSTTVNQVIPSLIQTGVYNHSYLGISTAPITPQLVEANELNVTSGVYVHEVIADGPATGVLHGSTEIITQGNDRVPVGGDVIVAIEGHRIASQEELSSFLLAETNPGDTVSLTIIRDGDRQDVTVTLGERPEPNIP